MSFHTMHTVSCDHCKRNYEHGHWAKKSLIKAASLAGWIISGRITICPDCDVF